MKLTGKLTKESKSLSAALSPRSGGGKVVDVVYGSAAGESVVNDEGVAIIPPYPTIPPIPVKGVMQGNKNLVDENGIARIPRYNVTRLFLNSDHLDLSTVTLSDDLDNYDAVEFIVEDGSYLNFTSFIYDTDFVINSVPYVGDNPTGTYAQLFLTGYDNHYLRMTMGQTNDKLIIPSDKNTLRLYEVRGIKYN